MMDRGKVGVSPKKKSEKRLRIASICYVRKSA